MKVICLTTRSDLERRVEEALGSAQYVVDSVKLDDDSVGLIKMCPYSGILLDSVSVGFEATLKLVPQLRRARPSAAIFIFERYLEIDQRLELFEIGADECVKEPFFASELAVKLGLFIRLRQAAVSDISILRAGDLVLDLVRRKVARQGVEIELRPKEFLLLEYLMRNANRPVSRTMIIEHVWNSYFEGLTNVVDVYISSLRRKVDSAYSEKLIRTSRGVGYQLTCTDSVKACHVRISDSRELWDRDLNKQLA